MFIDKAKINIKSGKGGNGAVSFRREANVPQGGPDGGNGGKGGDVVIVADRNLRTLMDFKYRTKYEAERGEDGRGRQQFGKDGEDLIIKVPVGTVVKDVESNAVMADLIKDGQSVIAAKGGRGGKGNVLFKNSVRQAPNFAEAGGFARERQVELELKLIADVGLVGYPNVGKSTFLSVSTSANPKIANYHFTTLTPNLGVVGMYGGSFVMADIPGLIEGASEGQGLGLDFLKHIERTRIIIHVVDISGSEGRDPIEDFDKINNELESYSAKLAKKPQIVCANKTDMLYSDEDWQRYEEFKAYVEGKGYTCYPCSAPIHEGVQDVLNAAYNMLQNLEDEPEEETAFFVDKNPEDEEDYREIYIEETAEGFHVWGKQLEKIFNSTNFNDAGSLRYLYRYIEDNGAIDRMLEMGLDEGDIITVIDYDFEYYDE
ncbi:MAG: GTPase ObgE [Clostridia bacterium]|nr:GTPase ObgE [Clostridia bacterium]